MAIIKNPLTLIKQDNSIIGEYNIEQVITGDDCELLINDASKPKDEPIPSIIDDIQLARKCCKEAVLEGVPSKKFVFLVARDDTNYIYIHEIYERNNISIKTSDGAYYTYTPENEGIFVHTWDKTKDIPSKENPSIKYRWIAYFSKDGTLNNPSVNYPALYIAYDGITSSTFTYTATTLQSYYLKWIDILNGSNIKIGNGGGNLFQDTQLIKMPKFSDKGTQTSFGGTFKNDASLTDISELDLSNTTDISHIFDGCSNLRLLSNNLDISKVKRLDWAFNRCSSLLELPENLDFSSATDMSYCFNYCYSIQELNLKNTQNVVKFQGAFNYCKSLRKLSFDAKSATSTYGWFENKAGQIKEVNIKNINANFNINNILTNITHDSLVNGIINNLVDRTGQTQLTLTLNPNQLKGLTEEEKAIATNKNWILK